MISGDMIMVSNIITKQRAEQNRNRMKKQSGVGKKKVTVVGICGNTNYLCA